MVLLAGSAAPAQTGTPALRGGTTVVIDPVTVLDAKGEPVSGLGPGDFRLTDNGTQQAFRMDTSDTLNSPIAMVVIVQTAEFSAGALAKVRKVGSMIQPLITGERGQAAVLSYDEDVRVEQELSSDAGLLTKTFRGLKSHGSGEARMLDAVQAAMGILAGREGERKVILVIGEAKDRGSKSKLEDELTGIERDGVIVYAITYSAYATTMTAKPSDLPPPSGGTGILGGLMELGRMGKANASEVLSEASGGERFSFAGQKVLERRVTELGAHLHSQYLLSFAPGPAAATGMHALRVAVEGHSDYRVRARQGYVWQGE
jgi:VWFA-related protein